MNLCIPTTINTDYSIKADWRNNIELADKPGLRFRALKPYEWSQVFYQDWIDKLYSICKIPPMVCVIFDRDPEFVDLCYHRDIEPYRRQPQYYCFNILEDPTPDSELVWYHTDQIGQILEAPSVDTYEQFDVIPDTDIIFRSRLENRKLYLCNTSIVHNVKMGKRPRTCFSFKFRDTSNWKDAIDMYKHILVK